MKCNFSSLSYALHLCIPVSSKVTSFTEMDSLSRKFCLCYLTVKTVQVCVRKIPFLSEIRFLHFGLLGYSFQRGISTTSAEYAQSSRVKETIMGKKDKSFDSEEISPRKKLKVEASKEKKLAENKRQRPNYFVAVQISNPEIHEAIQRIQDHIIAQNIKFNACMNSIATLHITLMVMSITDAETHKKALIALQNVHDEYNDEMCKNPLKLEFVGLGHFKNRVLYAKIKENESFGRLCVLAESVRKHFADFEITSTDERAFNPHLTIAKIDFSKKKQKALKKIEPSLYEAFLNKSVGSETVVGIQLLSMTSPKNDAGYYIGKNLIFESNISCRSLEANMADINEKKKDIRTKIANLTRKLFK